MNLKDLAKIINASFLTCEHKANEEVKLVGASDMLSDILAIGEKEMVVLTGLTNLQVIRTAQMLDLQAIVFVRGKRPSDEIIKLAIRYDIPLLLTKEKMFTACGKLYEAGFKGLQ